MALDVNEKELHAVCSSSVGVIQFKNLERIGCVAGVEKCALSSCGGDATAVGVR